MKIKLSRKKLSLILALVALLLLLFPYSGKPYVVEPKPSSSQAVIGQVFVTNHGWHTGIVVPSNIITAQVPDLAERFKDTPFIEIGWGDKGFYQSAEVTTGLTLRAMFWSSGSVIHAVAVADSPACFFPESSVTEIGLTKEQLDALTEFLVRSFKRNEQKQLIPLKSGIYGDSQFYAAEGRYQLLNTCNKWTAKALVSAGIDIQSTFKLTANSVMATLKDRTNTYVYPEEHTYCMHY